MPHHISVGNLNKQFESSGSVIEIKHITRALIIRSETNITAVREIMTESSETPTRCRAQN